MDGFSLWPLSVLLKLPGSSDPSLSKSGAEFLFFISPRLVLSEEPDEIDGLTVPLAAMGLAYLSLAQLFTQYSIPGTAPASQISLFISFHLLFNLINPTGTGCMNKDKFVGIVSRPLPLLPRARGCSQTHSCYSSVFV